MNKKILFCDNSLKELLNFRKDIIMHYATHEFKVVLVAPQNCELKISHPNITYIPLPMSRASMNPFKDLIYFTKLLKIYRNVAPNYIFHYTIKPNIYGSIAARMCNIPSTAMVAGLGYVFNKKSIGCYIARILYRFALQFPEHVFVLNTYNYDTLLNMNMATPHQLILLKGGEGVNLKQFQN